MKTTKQWLNTLPKGLKESAIKNMYKSQANIKRDYLSQAVYYGVDWYKTKDGGQFWCGFHFNLRWADGINWEMF